MKKTDIEKMSTEEIESAIYGDGGLYDRVVEKITELSVRKVSEMSGKSTQNINVFRNRRSSEYKPKLETIVELAHVVGIK